MSFVGGP